MKSQCNAPEIGTFHPRWPSLNIQHMEPYILILLGAGALILICGLAPDAFQELPLSLPIFCVAIGYLLFQFSSVEGESPPA